MRLLDFVVLALLCGVVIAQYEQQLYDPRCAPPTILASDLTYSDIPNLEIDVNKFNDTKEIYCKQNRKLVPPLQEHDDWETLVSVLKSATRIEEASLGCKNFPQYTGMLHYFLAEENESEDCDWISQFCQPCGGCKGIDDQIFLSLESAISWAKSDIKEGTCLDRTIIDNMRTVKNKNLDWFVEIRTQCENCWQNFCNSTADRILYDKVMKSLDGDEAAWKKLCLSGSINSVMNALHLQDRYGNFDYYLEQLRVFSHYSTVALLFHASWMPLFMAFLYLWGHNLCNPWRAEEKKADSQEDKIMQWVIRRLAEGKTRKTRPERFELKRLRRAARKIKKVKKSKSGGTHTKKTKKAKKSKQTITKKLRRVGKMTGATTSVTKTVKTPIGKTPAAPAQKTEPKPATRPEMKSAMKSAQAPKTEKTVLPPKVDQKSVVKTVQKSVVKTVQKSAQKSAQKNVSESGPKLQAGKKVLPSGKVIGARNGPGGRAGRGRGRGGRGGI